MTKQYYPAVFHPEETGYSVRVPDLDGCFSQGETFEEAVQMIEDAIGLYLADAVQIIPPSAPDTVKIEACDFMVLVPYDEAAYKRRQDTRAVKKTLTIPAWLNEAAEAAHINFSGVLQSGLKDILNIK